MWVAARAAEADLVLAEAAALCSRGCSKIAASASEQYKDESPQLGPGGWSALPDAAAVTGSVAQRLGAA